MSSRLLLLLCTSRSSLLKPGLPTLSTRCQPIKNYSNYNEDDDDRAIGEKARSTAEEFSWVAKVKAEAVKRSKTAYAAFEGLTATPGESDYEVAKQKLKETVEKGAHENKGKE